MQTKIVEIIENSIDMKTIEEAGQIIRNGGLVAFPTETVYGLGGDALNGASSERIYAAKGRPSDNPLIIHVNSMEDLEQIVEEIPEAAKLLAGRFWPGPLTMILNKAECVPLETTGGLGTVAVRMPSHHTARALIEASGGFLAAPSANLSGRPSPTIARYVIEDLDGRIDMIIDGGEASIGLESTIIDLTGAYPVILRPGFITEEMIKETVGEIDTDKAMISSDSGTRPRAPGMKYRHYAPKGSLAVVIGSRDEVTDYINRQIAVLQEQGIKTGIICTDETIEAYQGDSIKSVGKRRDEEEIARHLFQILRELDEEDAAVIFAEAFDDKGIGQAIMNRLLKAAGYKVIHLDKERETDGNGNLSTS